MLIVWCSWSQSLEGLPKGTRMRHEVFVATATI